MIDPTYDVYNLHKGICRKVARSSIKNRFEAVKNRHREFVEINRNAGGDYGNEAGISENRFLRISRRKRR